MMSSLKMPEWLRGKVDEEDFKDLLPALPPRTAEVQRWRPPTSGSEPEPQLAASGINPVAIMRKATELVEKYEKEQAGGRKREEALQIALTEETLAHKSTQKKVGFLELENAEIRNNLQAALAQNVDMKRFLSKIKEMLDFFSIEKRVRNNNGKKKPAALAAAQTPPETVPAPYAGGPIAPMHEVAPKEEEKAPCEPPASPSP